MIRNTLARLAVLMRRRGPGGCRGWRRHRSAVAHARQGRSRSASRSRSRATSPIRARPRSSGYKLWANTVNAKGGVLGRQGPADHPGRRSSPTQAATNYQNFITKNKVDLVFGPVLDAAHGAVGRGRATATATRSSSPPAVARRCSTRSSHNVFFTQPAPVVESGDVFAKCLLSLPKSQRPKTAAYPSLDDPFSSPIADRIRGILEKAGVKTVYNDDLPVGDDRHVADRREDRVEPRRTP